MLRKVVFTGMILAIISQPLFSINEGVQVNTEYIRCSRSPILQVSPSPSHSEITPEVKGFNTFEKDSPDYTALPCFPVGGTILIGATIDGREGFAILDTGAPMLILNQAYFSGSEDLSKHEQVVGINGQVQPVTSGSATLQLGGFIWKKAYAKIYDLSHLEESKKVPILALLGANLFHNMELVFDMQNHQIHLYRLDDRGERLHQSTARETPSFVLPLKMKGHLPYLLANTGGVSLKMGIDSGAGIALIKPRKQAQLQPFLETAGVIRVKGVGKKTSQVPVQRLNNLTLAGLNYHPLRVGFRKLEHLNELLGGSDIDGILGLEFLSLHKMAINYKKRELHIWAPPNAGLRMAGRE